MRQVKRRPILSYFYADKERKRNVRHFPFLFRQSHKLNPLSLTVFICLCFCVAGFYSVLSLAAGISLLSLLVIVYFHTKASANNLYVTRKVSSCQIFQGEKVQVGLTLINTSVGRSACVTLKDKFSASEDEIVEFYFPEGLKAKTKVKKYYEKECDGGVGVKDIGPTVLEVSDGFGLFHFTVHDDQIDQLEVLPRIGSLPEAPLKGSLNSAVYGNYEVEQRGYSVKLQGIREYAHGDSLKHVAWKITAKHNEIMVKEFDRMVNSNVYVAANDHPTLHIGKKQHSTWEVTREICLSLISQQIEVGNSVQYLGGEFSYNLSEAQCTFEVLAKKMANQKIEEESYDAFTPQRAGKHFTNLYKKVQANSTLYYITPYVDTIAGPLIETMNALRLNHVKTIVVLIDINSYLATFSQLIDFKKGLYIPPSIYLNDVIKQLQSNDVDLVLVHSEVPVSQSFLHFKMEAG